MPGITAAEVRAVQLRRPPWGKRGYVPAEVDAFLARAADALEALTVNLVSVNRRYKVHAGVRVTDV